MSHKKAWTDAVGGEGCKCCLEGSLEYQNFFISICDGSEINNVINNRIE
jgi:hypothetical protein